MTDEQYQSTLYALAGGALRRALDKLATLRELLSDHPADDALAAEAACAAGAESAIECALETLQATRLMPTAPDTTDRDAGRASRRASGAPATGSTP